MKPHIPKLFLALLLWNAPMEAYSQGTAFTYTGRLSDNGTPANGTYDLRFTLYDVNVAGDVIAGPLPVSPVDVVNGLFMVRLDFGPNAFTGPPRWLNIEVRPMGGANFTLLSPRQEVTSSPYAIRAASADSVASGAVTANQLSTGGVAPAPGQFLSYNGGNLFWSDPGVAAGNIWSLNGNSTFYNAGNVGIGSSAPAHRLAVVGGPFWTANQWLGAVEFPSGGALGWQANQAGQRFGMGHTSGGFYMFRTASNPGTTGSPALYDFMVNDAGNVGIGTTTPSARLQVVGDWNGEQGALQLSGHRPTIRLTGNADSANQSWLLHLGGPSGNLGFFRRTGPAAWSPVMQLTTSGRQMEIYGQDALGLIGFQPFLTLFDSNAGYAASRIQAANGDLILETASYIAGQADTGMVLKNGTGFVGLGTTAPVAKLHAETPLANTAAVYGKATGSGGVGVYGQSTSGTAVHAEGNATQPHDKGGFVKAMLYVNSNGIILRCYNGVTGGSTDGCGFTVNVIQAGVYRIHFGFQVSERFVSVSAAYRGGTGSATPGYNRGANFSIDENGNYIDVFTFVADDPDDTFNSRFMIVVY